MRRHPLFPRFAPAVDPARYARVAQAAYLVAARLQPSFSNAPQAFLDLVFLREGEVALAPYLLLEPAMITIRESSPFLWPLWLPIDEQAIGPIEALVEPWLIAHALLGGVAEERIGFFTTDAAARELFEAARAARFLCAAPAEDVLGDASPYLYAQRFVKGRRVAIASSTAAYGASLLSNDATSVYADLGDETRNALARDWYALGIYGELPKGSFDVVIGDHGAAEASSASIALQGDGEGVDVSAVAPIFAPIASSFDLRDGPELTRFRVRARDPILRPNRIGRAPIIGGSAGRIAVVIRDDGFVSPDADVDQARALVEALVTQGFDAKLTVATAARAEGADLVHLFGNRHVHQFSIVLEEAQRLGVPVVVTPLFDDAAAEAMWGTAAVRATLVGVRDLAAEGAIERGMARRLLLVQGGSERGRVTYDPALMRQLFAQCGAAVFASATEERLVRGAFGYTGPSRVVPCVPASPVEPEPVGALCGFDEYVLIHGTLDPRGNQHLALRAASAIGAPCVLVGVVEEADYYHTLIQSAEHVFIWIPEQDVSPGQLAAIYAGARVYADLAWAGHGAFRAVRAAGHGAVPVLSTTYPFAELWPDLTGGVDPASPESAVAALRQAWMRAPSIARQVAERAAQLADPLRSLQMVLGAYAEAAGVKAV